MTGRPITLTQTSYFNGCQLDSVKDAEIVWTITSPCFSNVLCYALPECVIRGSASVHRFFFPRCTASRSACCRFIHTGIKQGCLLYYPSLCLVLCMDMHYNSCFLYLLLPLPLWQCFFDHRIAPWWEHFTAGLILNSDIILSVMLLFWLNNRLWSFSNKQSIVCLEIRLSQTSMKKKLFGMLNSSAITA